MSAVGILRSLLSKSTDLLLVVPVARIMAGVLPQKTAFPAIALTEISRVDRLTLRAGTHSHCTARVQITVFAKTYAQQKEILTLVRRACRDKVGELDSTVVASYWAYFFHKGVANVSVVLDGTGPDFFDDGDTLYMQSQDFKVSFTEAT